MFLFSKVWVMHQLLFIQLIQYCWAWLSPSPLLPGFPFLFLWNAPTELCQRRFAIKLDLSYFQLVSSTLKSATNQSISIFYSDRFGIFPYVDKESGQHYDDGLPQLIDFHKHWKLAQESIILYIPEDTPGLAVLDLEEWRPQWVRNWGSKDIYREQSIQAIVQSNLSLSYEQVQTLAVMMFEKAAKMYFLKSLNLGKKLRPSREWGYYLYPDCYNYDYNHDMDNYTGECPEIEKSRNDELLWLWNASTALFPSIYLEHILQESYQGMLYVRHRIQEALRVSMLPSKNQSIPVYAYIRPCFKDSEVDYLSKYDLVNTIGEAAALGASGVVFWGNMNVTSSEAACRAVKHHLEKVLNPYILNVTTASQLCSEALCQAKGRCVRKAWDSEAYLHLSPHRYHIHMDHTNRFVVKGHLSQEDVNWFEERFDCVCYTEQPCFTPLTLKRFSTFVHNEGLSLSHIFLQPLLASAMTAVWVIMI